MPVMDLELASDCSRIYDEAVSTVEVPRRNPRRHTFQITLLGRSTVILRRFSASRSAIRFCIAGNIGFLSRRFVEEIPTLASSMESGLRETQKENSSLAAVQSFRDPYR